LYTHEIKFAAFFIALDRKKLHMETIEMHYPHRDSDQSTIYFADRSVLALGSMMMGQLMRPPAPPSGRDKVFGKHGPHKQRRPDSANIFPNQGKDTDLLLAESVPSATGAGLLQYFATLELVL
jgi:hypothetical protein